MESAPPSSSSFVFSYEFSSSSRNLVRRGSEIGGSRVPRLIRRIVTAILICIFATVGVVVGAITGGLIGLATESGIFRGSAIGAISGAVFSIEAVESSLAIWSGSGIYSILFVVDIILSLLSGRLVREKVGPAVQNAVERQMSAMDAPSSDVSDIFETSSGKGMTKEMVEKLPKVVVTAENNVDASGEPICCSVCLQDLEVGETVRRLPRCEHMFHVPCIDGWLVGHGSCPLCRRDF